MLFRRAEPKAPNAQCQSCARIRLFLAVAGLLIIALPLIGDKAAPLATLTPMTIALVMMGIGAFAFVIRLIAWLRSEAQPRTEQDSPTR